MYYGDRSFAPFVPTDVAVPFELQPGQNTVTDIPWWGGCFFGSSCPTGDSIVTFYADNGGSPGAPIQSFVVGDPNQTATGNMICSGGFCTTHAP